MTDILIISRQRITGRTNGSSTYLLDIAHTIRAAGFRVHLLHPSPTMMGRTPVARLSSDLDVFASHRARGVMRLGDVMISLDWRTYVAAFRGAAAALGRRLGLRGGWTIDRPSPYSVSIPWTAGDRAYVRRHARGVADIMVADYVFQADAFMDAPSPATPTAIIMHDLFHARDTAREAGSGRDAVAGMDAPGEAAMLSRAQAVIAIQRSEAHWVEQHAPHVRSILAPLSVAAVAYVQPGEDDRLLFVGSNTAPNVVGLRWFLDHVWPTVLTRRPTTTLDVAGSVCRAFDGVPSAGVRFLGVVDSLAGAYARAAVVVSPLTFGSGLKIKLVEAMAAGKAIVATTITLQGVVEECGDAVAVADDPAHFAEAVLDLLDEPSLRIALAEKALESARRHFVASVCHRDLVDWLLTAAGDGETPLSTG